jgi:selenocysteine-specific elongation factor
MDPTSRIAIQLSKVSRGDVGMGSLLSKGGLHLSRRMDCVLDYLKAPLRKNTQATFYFGTLEEDCLIVPVSEGSQSIARILFKRPIPARFADRFIIRTHGEEYLLAAGWVADPNARSKTHRSLKELLSGANPTLDFFLRVEAVLEGTLRIPELLHRSAFTRNNIQTNLNSNDFESLDADNYVSKSALPNIKKEIVNLLNTKGPLNQKEIKKALLIKHPVALIESTLQLGNQTRWWEIRGQQVTPVQKDQPLSDGEKRLLESIASPPHLWERDELLKRVETEGALKKLVKAGELIPLKDGLFTSGKFYKEMEKRVEEFLKKNGKATTSELKAVLGGVSRKYAIPLLEKMDENRLTYLKNGVRQLLK